MPEVEEGDYLNCMLNGETVELEVAYEASLGEFTMYATPASSSVRSSYQIETGVWFVSRDLLKFRSMDFPLG